MARAGSKPIYTDALAAEVLAGLATGLTEKDACAAAGISEDTWGRWLKGQRGAPADLAERSNRAIPRRTRTWLGGLSDLARNGDGIVRIKALEALLDRCSDYRKSATLQHTGPGGGPIAHTHRDLSAFTDDEIDALAAMVERRRAGELVS